LTRSGERRRFVHRGERPAPAVGDPVLYVARMPDTDTGAARARAGAADVGGERPRLLVLTPDFPPAHGGLQLFTHRLVSGLEGFEIEVLTLASSGADSFDASSGLAITRVRAPVRLGRARNAVLGLAALAAAARFRPQLQLNMHIVTSPAAAVVRRTLAVPTVQYFYAKEVGARPRLAAFAARHADASVAISSYTVKLLAAAGVPSGADVRLIPPGVDLPSDTSPLDAARPTIVTVSRLADPYKGHDVMIEALRLVRAAVPDVEWIVIGEGPLRPGLESLARSRGVADAVRFLGAVSDSERDRWLRSADVFAMPSRLPGGGRAGEGFGIVYLEAGTYGKPVVAGNVAGAPDAVLDGETGLLVDPADPREVADAITRLLGDPELADRLGRAGRERAATFSWQSMARSVEALLREPPGGVRGR
jgi:phosphatidylinositol alpha-1,6-mannosyltransferase